MSALLELANSLLLCFGLSELLLHNTWRYSWLLAGLTALLLNLLLSARLHSLLGLTTATGSALPTGLRVGAVLLGFCFMAYVDLWRLKSGPTAPKSS